MNESTGGTWEIPGGETVQKVSAAFAAVADEQLGAAYKLGVQDSMLRATQIERVLTDLIEDLRERHRPTPTGYLCEHCTEDYLWPCPEAQAADRAEARLRKVFGDE